MGVNCFCGKRVIVFHIIPVRVEVYANDTLLCRMEIDQFQRVMFQCPHNCIPIHMHIVLK